MQRTPGADLEEPMSPNYGLVEATEVEPYYGGSSTPLTPRVRVGWRRLQAVIAHDSRLTLGTIRSTGSGTMRLIQSYVGLNPYKRR